MIYQIKIDNDDNATFNLLRKLEDIAITGTMHSASCDNIAKFVTILDEKNLYFFNFEEEKPLKIYNDVNAVSMQNFTEHVNFIVVQEVTGSKAVKGGVKCFSNRVLFDNKVFAPIEISNTAIGALGQFEYYSANQRIGLISSVDSLLIMPLMHRTVMKFIGVQEDAKYVCYK